MESIQNYQQSLLNQVFTQKLKENEKQTKIWVDYKKRHEKVIEGLRVFPLSLSENCMVPIGKLAFMKGKLTHTNEILVCLGDDYFAKYSASQAIALCNRRIEGANEMLKNLEAERNLYDMRQILPLEHDVFGETDRKEILEHWNEDKLDKWRAQHKQRQKEYHQNLAKLREKEEKEESNDHNEEELFKRLDELELKEELEDEICRLETERKGFYGDDLEEGEVYDESDLSEEDDLSDSSEITMEMLEEELKGLRQLQANKITNNVSNASNCEMVQEVECSNTNVTENEQSNLVTNSNQKSLEENSFAPTDASESTKNTKEKRKVLFVEPCAIEDENNIEDEMSTFEIGSARRDDSDENSEDDDDIVRIEISHSSHTPNVPESNTTKIQSPMDIYKMFDASCPNTPSPKSILKRSPNDMPSEAIASLNKDNSTDVDEDKNGPVKSYTKSFEINDVVERKVIPSTSPREEKKNAEKSMSRFKMKRVGILGN